MTLERWPDIWLHEGFATWSEWRWSEHTGGPSAAETLKGLEATDAGDSDLWSPPPGDPGDPADLFSGAVYARGAMTLEALRERIGDEAFTRLLRTWYARHRYGNATTAQFTALAERLTGRDLAAFFRAWLYEPGKPPAEFL